jgi:anti-sigma factor RsiW
MGDSLNHDEIRAQLPFYVAGTLDAATMKAIQQHINACLECAQSSYEWQALATAIRMEAEARVPALPPLRLPAPARSTQRLTLRWTQVLVASLIALVTIGLVLGVFQGSRLFLFQSPTVTSTSVSTTAALLFSTKPGGVDRLGKIEVLE